MVFACGQANGDNFGGDFTGFTAAGSGPWSFAIRFVFSWGVQRERPLASSVCVLHWGRYWGFVYANMACSLPTSNVAMI
jgi:hypothetical protein